MIGKLLNIFIAITTVLMLCVGWPNLAPFVLSATVALIGSALWTRSYFNKYAKENE